MKYFSNETIEKIRQGYYTAVYFNRTKEILLKEGNLKKATMQIFQRREESILAGIDETVELLQWATGYYQEGKPTSAKSFGEARWIDKSKELDVESLSDGDKLSAMETVMHIRGPYAYFAHLESLYLGILARRSLVAGNTRKCVEAAGGKPVIFFGDRFDYFLNQEGDGYAAYTGGAAAVCTAAQARLIPKEAAGTIPHGLIALNEGDTVKTTGLFNKYFPEERLIALVDFDNDSVNTALAVAKKLGRRLWGVRLDTAGDIIDVNVKVYLSQPKSFQSLTEKVETPEKRGEFYGVNKYLVKAVREALDKEGFKYVKIVVSGGFYPNRIKEFTMEKIPVDAYGIGSSIIHGENDFTADIVEVEGRKTAKAGREFRANNKLKKIMQQRKRHKRKRI
ncbi:hypothetical protein A2777_04795 [Candidatus Gottesmanbacteria bacterium RIFCSPHIGHO2_01_FULL_40_15]|uniref:nicotinate phosphoribosyltransferase n=1 Tax=Candidatus Gottesmanbacteria bacterium RIFCSPHIGHO2_01_FULL_40_15 TaxID=1798376 RepID=A0A1F5Z149_9BACT|nr:MAG: hypothetical protein A2777_04795 [Candidatus Gottesmanbacteria bacterium RIFCSPHIGHO2_01_FULL_40_15]